MFQLHRGGQLYWIKYLETTTDLPRIMCQSKVTYIFLHYKNQTKHVGLVQSGYYYHLTECTGNLSYL